MSANKEKELKALKENTPFSMPPNPSKHGWNERDIQTRFWKGYFLLYEYLDNFRTISEEEIGQLNERLPIGVTKILSGESAPTSSTEGEVGQLYIEASNPPVIHQCQSVDGNEYTWDLACNVIEAIPCVSYDSPEENRKVWFDLNEEQEEVEEVEEQVLSPTSLRNSSQNNNDVLDMVINSNNEITLNNFEDNSTTLNDFEDNNSNQEEITLNNFE